MDIKTFKQLMKMLDESLKLNDDNMSEKSLEIPLLYHKYLDIYSKELRRLKKLHIDKKKLFGTLYEQIKHHGNISWDTKAEIESQIYRDTSYYQLCVEYNEAETMVNQLELCLKNIQNMSFQIKNFVEYRKLFGV